jgi:crotonobetainyl-CoA:carnitine CoA-transferase CaiB-like acyl-CoA transferase
MDPIPGLGEHSEAILGELGYSDRDISALKAGGVI